jgi:hypothetical protein
MQTISNLNPVSFSSTFGREIIISGSIASVNWMYFFYLFIFTASMLLIGVIIANKTLKIDWSERNDHYYTHNNITSGRYITLIINWLFVMNIRYKKQNKGGRPIRALEHLIGCWIKRKMM